VRSGCAVRGAGFTLIEVVVAMVVAAILAAIAIPQYTAYTTRAKRSEAKAVLAQAAQFMERNYTQAGAYNLDAAANPPAALAALPASMSQAPLSGTANYLITLSAVAAQSFTLSATPVGSPGFTDADCGTLTLDNTGLQGATGGTLSAADCWRR